jgi:hypothetical protein
MRMADSNGRFEWPIRLAMAWDVVGNGDHGHSNRLAMAMMLIAMARPLPWVLFVVLSSLALDR